MKPCHEMRGMIYPYIDEEISPTERERLEAHLRTCFRCREAVDSEIAFRERFVQPLKGLKCPQGVRERLRPILNWKGRSQRRGRGNPLFKGAVWLALAGCAAVMAFLLVNLLLGEVSDLRPIVEASIKQHEKFLRGSLPIENYDWTRKGVENWFKEKVDFTITLPNLSDDDLSIVGERLSHLRGLDSAYVIMAYNGDYVSLFCFNGDNLKWSGGREERVGGNTFYHFQWRDSHVVLWKRGDLGYALVSHRGEVPWRDLAMGPISAKRPG